MKLSINTAQFRSAMAIVTRAVTNKALPILGNVCIKTEGDRLLSLRTTNLTMWIETYCRAVITEHGGVTISAKLLNDILKTWSTDYIEMSLQSSRLKIHGPSSHAYLAVMPATEFPVMPNVADQSVEPIVIGNVDAHVLANAINRTVFCASMDESRPVLTHMCLEAKNRQLSMMATDGYRLALESIAIERDVETRMLVSGNSMRELSKILLMAKGTVFVAAKNNLASWDMGTPENNRIVVVTSLSDAKFPMVESIIPTEHKLRRDVSANELLEAVRFVMPFTEDNRSIELAFEGNTLTVRAGEAEQTIHCLSDMAEMSIRFDGRFLMEALSVLQDQMLNVKLYSDTRPGLLSRNSDDKYLHVIMPMQPKRK